MVFTKQKTQFLFFLIKFLRRAVGTDVDETGCRRKEVGPV